MNHKKHPLLFSIVVVLSAISAFETIPARSLFAQTNTATQQMRIGTWNISDYRGFGGNAPSRTADLQNALFGSFQGRTFSPDILFAQEIQSPEAALDLLTVMNNATGSTGDWAVTFDELEGTSVSSDAAMFYRTSLVSSVSTTLVLPMRPNENPRDVVRHDFSVAGNAATNEVFSVYNVHMKAGSRGSDQARRQIEATAIRADANTLAANHQIMVLGDFNIQDSDQAAFQTLTSSAGDSRGQVLDPINTLGEWNDDFGSRFVHTQDPVLAMDDRLDMILMGEALGDGIGTEYVGNFGDPYSTVTWDDPDHSYRVWGNDGTSFNEGLTIGGNAMVGSSIADSLVDIALTSGGHLPVFADISFQVNAIPEPSGLVLVVVGSIGALVRRRRTAFAR